MEWSKVGLDGTKAYEKTICKKKANRKDWMSLSLWSLDTMEKIKLGKRSKPN